MIDRKHCEGCPLEEVSQPSEVHGNTQARFMIVTDTPSRFNAAKGRILPESSTRMFSKHMETVGFSRPDFLFVPQIRCPHEADQYETKQKREIQKHCREHLLDDIHEFRPELIVPLGGEPARQVMGRAVKITKVRGVAEYNEEHGAMVMAMLNPGQVTMYPQHESVFAADCRTMARVVNSEYDVLAAGNELLGDYEFIDDLQFLIDMEPKLLFFDTETTGLEYFKEGPDNVRDYDPRKHGKEFNPRAAILTMQFCVRPGEAYMLVWDHPEAPMPLRKKRKVLQQLTQLLCNPKTRVIGQNAKYDNTYFFAQTGVRYKIGGDTLMIAALLDENMISKAQSVLVKHYVPEMGGYSDSFDATVDKSRMWEVPLAKLLGYGCGDVDSGFRLYKAMIKVLMEDPRLFAHYRYVSIPGLNVFSGVETRGILIDENALDEFEEVIATSVATQYTSLMAQVPKSIKRKHIDKGLKFSRADFVRDILFSHRDGFRLRPKVYTDTTKNLPADKRVPSTSTKDHLPYFYDECPFSMELAQYVKDERLLGTNIRSFKKKYIHEGLVRPTYSLHTAVTGRSASENPNGQNFPKRGPNAKAYRRIFVPPPGYYVLEADLSQAELRIAADMANDRQMLRIYQNKGDIHSATAAIVVGVPLAEFMTWGHDKRKLMEVANSIPGSGSYLRKLPAGKRAEATVRDYYKMKRQEAKAINFGFIYGMGWRKFIGYAKTQYGVEFTEEEAQQIRTTFFETYSGLPAWHEAMRQFAMREEYVRSYSGRVRHLPMIRSEDDGVASEAGRQAINSPVQEFASSLGIMACGRLHEEIDPEYIAPIAFVHDAIFSYVKMEYLEWGAKTLKWYMESNDIEGQFGVKMKCPIIADVSFGMNFGDTNEMEGMELDKPYDFGQFWDEEKQSGLLVPRQRIPPNNGRALYPPYTSPVAA